MHTNVPVKQDDGIMMMMMMMMMITLSGVVVEGLGVAQVSGIVTVLMESEVS
jgi:hypothetical protein